MTLPELVVTVEGDGDFVALPSFLTVQGNLVGLGEAGSDESLDESGEKHDCMDFDGDDGTWSLNLIVSVSGGMFEGVILVKKLFIVTIYGGAKTYLYSLCVFPSIDSCKSHISTTVPMRRYSCRWRWSKMSQLEIRRPNPRTGLSPSMKLFIGCDTCIRVRTAEIRLSWWP